MNSTASYKGNFPPNSNKLSTEEAKLRIQSAFHKGELNLEFGIQSAFHKGELNLESGSLLAKGLGPNAAPCGISRTHGARISVAQGLY